MAEPRIVLCPENHIYDAALYSECPYCKKKVSEQKKLAKTLGNTSYKERNRNETINPHVNGARSPASDAVIENAKAKDFRPVIGWLVILSGPMTGKSLELSLGLNYLYIARDNCRIGAVQEEFDSTAVITYYDHHFFLKPSELSLCSINGMQSEGGELFHDDRIRIGNTEFIFIRLMNIHITWI